MSNSDQGNPSDVQEISVGSQSGVASICKKVLAVMREVGYVQKGGKNDFQGYKYASEADAIASLRPALIKHGLFLIPSVESVGMDEYACVNVTMLYRLFDEEGNFITFRAAGSGTDKNSKGVGDKGIYKALTGASKYALLKTFLMETGDDPEVATEHDRVGPVKAPEKAPEAPRKAHPDKVAAIPSDWTPEMFKECADSCTTSDELTELWTANQSILDAVKKDQKEVYDGLIQHFKALKTKLKG